MSFQTIIIAGHLGRDPEMRFTPAGQAVTNFNLAANRQYTDSSGQVVKETAWFRVSAWGKTAENCNQYLHKAAWYWWKAGWFVIQNRVVHRSILARIAAPDIIFDTDEEGRETTKLDTTLNTWEQDRRFIVHQVLKDEKDRAQLSFREGEECAYSFFVTNTDLSPGEVAEFYQKCCNEAL